MTAVKGPLGLYVHIPFCRSRCGYCSFVSGHYDEKLADAYIDAVLTELEEREIFSSGRQPTTLFLGGGTPSMLSEQQLETLLRGLPPATLESSCEVNPDSITPEKLQILRSYGINRLSFGVQTFSSDGLKMLGRAHDVQTALHALESARSFDFESLNVDLIHFWPGQDEALLRNDLKTATSVGAKHISTYSLILEPHCPEFEKYNCLMSSNPFAEDEARRFWDISDEYFENNGFIHYETSNFALSDFMCMHNVHTWQGESYLGLGVAAHSYIHGRRYANTSSLDEYIAGCRNPHTIEVYSETLLGDASAREGAVFWLRLFQGIHCQRFTEKFGYTLDALYPHILPRLIEQGLLEYSPDKTYLRVPKHIHPILDTVLVELI